MKLSSTEVARLITSKLVDHKLLKASYYIFHFLWFLHQSKVCLTFPSPNLQYQCSKCKLHSSCFFLTANVVDQSWNKRKHIVYISVIPSFRYATNTFACEQTVQWRRTIAWWTVDYKGRCVRLWLYSAHHLKISSQSPISGLPVRSSCSFVTIQH